MYAVSRIVIDNIIMQAHVKQLYLAHFMNDKIQQETIDEEKGRSYTGSTIIGFSNKKQNIKLFLTCVNQYTCSNNNCQQTSIRFSLKASEPFKVIHFT